MVSLKQTGPTSFMAIFRPRHRMITTGVLWCLRKGIPLTAVSSVRLAFITAIAAAGPLLGRLKKDGEVIARSLSIECRRALLYMAASEIPVEVSIRVRKQTPDYQLLQVAFSIGEDSAHSGSTTLLYCRPHLEGFSYL